MFLVIMPVVFFVFRPFFLENYKHLKKINFLEKNKNTSETCPENIKSYFESSHIEFCVPPDSDHRGKKEDGAHQIIELFFE